MHILYCDESGTTKDPHQEHFLFAGISVFERQSYWIANELDKLAKRINPADPGSIEFHGSHIWGGKGQWRAMRSSDRIHCMGGLTPIFNFCEPYWFTIIA